MKKLLITIGCALVAQVINTFAETPHERDVRFTEISGYTQFDGPVRHGYPTCPR